MRPVERHDGDEGGHVTAGDMSVLHTPDTRSFILRTRDGSD
jgi:hypothetical protein